MQLQKLMKNYLNENNQIEHLFNLTNKVMSPLVVKKNKWETDEENKTIKRIFEFSNLKQKDHFVIEIFKYLREHEVDIEINARNNNVTITIHAFSNNISELEIDASKDIEHIKKDVTYYYAK